MMNARSTLSLETNAVPISSERINSCKSTSLSLTLAFCGMPDWIKSLTALMSSALDNR